MQEESAESVDKQSSAWIWPCPLCQQGRKDRDALAQHLTDKHNVLPACLNKLLDTATPEQHLTGKGQEETFNSTDTRSSQEMPLETNGAPPEPSEEDASADTFQLTECQNIMKTDPEQGTEGKEDREQEGGSDHFDQDQDPTFLVAMSQTENGSLSGDSVSDITSTCTSKSSTDLVMEKFMDPNRPYKCCACLESFPSRSSLTVHYSSTSHTKRMRTGLAKQSEDKDAAQPVSRPFVSSKPYQCAVCRVSYNHVFTLESHMKSVLHQTRTRNAANSAVANPDGSNNNNANIKTRASTTMNALNVALSGSASTSNSDVQANPNSVPAATKDAEQSQAQTVPTLSLLSSPVASAQAMSAILTLLTSPSPTTPQLELVAQQQLLLPLFLNGLQAQNQSGHTNPLPSGAVLAQSVPPLSLSAAQQALLAQRLSSLQSQSAGPFTTIDCSVGQNVRDETGCEGESLLAEPRDVDKSMNTASPDLRCDADERGSTEKVTLKRDVNEYFSEGNDTVLRGDEDNLESENPQDKIARGNEFNVPLEGDWCDHRAVSESSNDAKDEPKCNVLPSEKHQHQCASLGNKGIFTNKAPSQLALELLNCINRDGLSGLKNSRFFGERPASCTNALGWKYSSGLPVLSEFQSQVLWAFLESRSEADAASPPREDCEALGREVGLKVEEVRRWLEEARQSRDRQRNISQRAVVNNIIEEEEDDDDDDDDDEGVLTIVESEGGDNQAIDLSHRRGRLRENHGESCLTSDSDNEGFYTSFIVTDDESQNSSIKGEPGSPAQEEVARERDSGGGKGLRSSTVFLSDAEDTDEDEDGGQQKVRKRKLKRESEYMEVKRERQDPDVDLELEAQTDPPPLSGSGDQHGYPAINTSGILSSLPLSLSLAPFSTQFINPYVVSLPSSLGISEGGGECNRRRASSFPNPPIITRCPDPYMTSLKSPPPACHMSTGQSLSNGGIYESALDLSTRKKHSSPSSASSFATTGGRNIVHKNQTLDGSGINSTALGVPGAGGLIVVRVKPDQSLAVPVSNHITNSNNAKASTVFIRAAERVNASYMGKERDKGLDKESEGDKQQQKNPKGRRLRDMRRSRTIIQSEQLDVLYGCYFKDPNPGKHEFERISEWVHLPKKVVQIWFQNMRARERKGEVRFISDGTLAAVGKPLIKFTWPLTLPIFSSSPPPNSNHLSSGGITRISAAGSAGIISPKIKHEKDQTKVKEESSIPKDLGTASSMVHSSVQRMLKPKTPVLTPAMAEKPPGKAISSAPAVPVVVAKTQPCPSTDVSQKRKRCRGEGAGDSEDKMDDEGVEHGKEKKSPALSNISVPKLSSVTPIKTTSSNSNKRNGLNEWTPKCSFKINTLSREQLGLAATPRSSVTPATTSFPSTPTSTTTSTSKSTGQEGTHALHSTPRRPRTHLTSLQVSIMQSCYETCPHPNALECETVGSELGLPLKVVQIWFQNTRAKEKRWRLQIQKQSPNSADSPKKVDTSSGSFLLYNALKANRPILPKPVQLTVLEPSAPPGSGQPAGRETLRGRCDACAVEFESRAAGRTHVFSQRHLATLRSTNFGQSPSPISKAQSVRESPSSASALQSSPNPTSGTS